MNTGAIKYELRDVCLAPARTLQMLAQLLRHDDCVVARPDRIVAHVRPDFSCKRLQDFFRVRGPFVHDLAWRAGRHNGDCRDIFWNVILFREAKPGAVVFIFR